MNRIKKRGRYMQDTIFSCKGEWKCTTCKTTVELRRITLCRIRLISKYFMVFHIQKLKLNICTYIYICMYVFVKYKSRKRIVREEERGRQE